MFKNIVIFSKTKWKEPPRLRHQLTRLLKKNGHNIIFFEKNSFLMKPGNPFIYSQPTTRFEEGIHFYSHPELLHHQLRPFRLFRKLNEYYELKYINKILHISACAEATVGNHQSAIRFKPDLIINFNYDYYFLKNLFPHIPLITIINDDFEAKAKFWMKKSARVQIRQTCVSSDIVLTVSYPLLKKLKKYNDYTYLFFPWAKNLYQLSTDCVDRMPGGEVREVVLYYGYINNKLDWEIINKLVQAKIKLRFIGPIAKNVRKHIRKLFKFNNFELLPACDIQNIDFNDVCCSIIPYDLNFKNNHSITVSNRIFNLLSYGIPIVNADLKYLIDSPKKVIQKCSDIKEYLEAIDFFKNNFSFVQADIADFLKDNYEENRYGFLLKLCKNVLLQQF